MLEDHAKICIVYKMVDKCFVSAQTKRKREKGSKTRCLQTTVKMKSRSHYTWNSVETKTNETPTTTI